MPGAHTQAETLDELQRQRMSAAITATQLALRDPQVRARYERKAKRQGHRAWNLALSDCLQGIDLHAKP